MPDLLQQEIYNRKKKGYNIVACVMCNHGQQQYFSDVILLSLQKEKIFYFFVNECPVNSVHKISEFKDFFYITQEAYLKIKGIDLALHSEIYCSSPHVSEICFIGHGFPGKHTVWSEENLKSFNHYFLYGPKDRKIFSYITKNYSNEISNRINLWEAGYPKYDFQFNVKKSEIIKIKQNVGVDNQKPTILFAPAWDPEGVLRTIGLALLKIFKNLKQYNFIVKLHPASLADKNSKHFNFYTGGIDWKKTISDFCKACSSNIFFPDFHSINPLFKISDLMITDFSGVTQGFFLENKPVISIDCPKFYSETLPQFGSDGKISRSNELFNNGRKGTFLLSDFKKIDHAIAHVLKNPDENAEARKKIALELLYNPGKGTPCMLSAIKNILQIEK